MAVTYRLRPQAEKLIYKLRLAKAVGNTTIGRVDVDHLKEEVKLMGENPNAVPVERAEEPAQFVIDDVLRLATLLDPDATEPLTLPAQRTPPQPVTQTAPAPLPAPVIPTPPAQVIEAVVPQPDAPVVQSGQEGEIAAAANEPVTATESEPKAAMVAETAQPTSDYPDIGMLGHGTCPRIANLRNAGINTIADLQAYLRKRKKLTDIKGIGKETAKLMKQYLRAYEQANVA